MKAKLLVIALLSLVAIAIACAEIKAQPKFYSLAGIDNTVFLTGNDGKVKENEPVSIKFNLAANNTYILVFEGSNNTTFTFNGVTTQGNFQSIEIVTTKDQTMVLWVKSIEGKAEYSYALNYKK